MVGALALVPTGALLVSGLGVGLIVFGGLLAGASLLIGWNA
jgi:hypothetical protein